MDDQPLYKSSEKILEEDMKRQLEFPIKELEDLLNDVNRKAKENLDLSQINKSDTRIDLNCYKLDNEPMWCGYNIEMNLIAICPYNKYEISCRLDSEHPPYEIECQHYENLDTLLVYRGSRFKLSNSLQNIYFIEGIKNSILNIINISYPEVLANMSGKYNIYTKAVVSMDYNNPRKENPEISKDSNKFTYNNGRYNIEMTWSLYDHIHTTKRFYGLKQVNKRKSRNKYKG